MTPEQQAAEHIRRAIDSVQLAACTLYPHRRKSGRVYQAHALLSATPLRLALETLEGKALVVPGLKLERDDAETE